MCHLLVRAHTELYCSARLTMSARAEMPLPLRPLVSPRVVRIYVVDGAGKTSGKTSRKTSRKADDAVEEEAHPRRVARKMRAATVASDETSDAPVV